MDETNDQETREVAFGLIRSSAANASAKLQFARIAFGAAGSAGADIDTGDAENVAKGWFANEKKLSLEWHGTRALMPKNKVKLMLNLVLVACGAIPRGGIVKAELDDPARAARITVSATGTSARVPPVFLALLNGNFSESLDAHAVQPLYTLKLAEQVGYEVSASINGDSVVFRAG